MARRSREQSREEIRGRRATAGVGGSKLAGLQDEAARILSEHGLDAPEGPTPGDEADQEFGARVLGPSGRPVRTAATASEVREDDIIAAAERIRKARAARRAEPKEEPAATKTPNGLLVITAEAHDYFLARMSPESADAATVAYAIIEAANALTKAVAVLSERA